MPVSNKQTGSRLKMTHSVAAPCSSSHDRMCRMLRRSMVDDWRTSLLISMATAPTPTAKQQASLGSGGER